MMRRLSLVAFWRRAGYEAREAARQPILWLEGDLTGAGQLQVHAALAEWHRQAARNTGAAFCCGGDGLGWLLASCALESTSPGAPPRPRDPSPPGVAWCGPTLGMTTSALNIQSRQGMVNGILQGREPDPPHLQHALAAATANDRQVMLDSARAPTWSPEFFPDRHGPGPRTDGWVRWVWLVVALIWLASNLVRFMAGQ